MTLLVVGLLLFLGTHALSMARGLRAELIGRLGAGGFKAVYSAGSLIGLALIVWGFGAYRASGYIPVWEPPRAMAHVATTLMLPAMILLFVYLFPKGRLKAAVGHPMLAMIKFWALAHLLANGDLGSIVLFGSFLAYGVAARISVKRRDGAAASSAAVAWGVYDGLAIVLGIAATLAFIYGLHALLIGVPVLAPR